MVSHLQSNKETVPEFKYIVIPMIISIYMCMDVETKIKKCCIDDSNNSYFISMTSIAFTPHKWQKQPVIPQECLYPALTSGRLSLKKT